MKVVENNATLVSRFNLTRELAKFHIQPDDTSITNFEPGQYIELGALSDDGLKLVRRQYSIASVPGKDSLELYIVCVKDGFFTPKLWALSAGDRMWVGTKVKGKFTLEAVDKVRNLLFLSTGTGIAPFISMVRTHLNTWPSERKIVIVHGTRLSEDFGYDEELRMLSEKHKNFHYIPIASREPNDSMWSGLRGRIQSILFERQFSEIVGTPLESAHWDVMLCGNPDMIDATTNLLFTKGFSMHSKKVPGNVHVERYW